MRPVRIWLAPLLLAIGTFTIGTSELIIAGILPLVADDLHVSVAAAGQLVTVYALGFGLGAPVLAGVLGRRFPRRPLLLALLAAFCVGNVVAALAPSYELLLAARALVAVLAGTFEVIAISAVAGMVAPHQRGRAIALVVGGFSVALILGVPLGTLLGLAAGWRATFVAIAVVGTVVALASVRLLPQIEEAVAGTPGRSPFSLLARRDLLSVLGATVLVFMGIQSMTAYFAPFLETRAGVDGPGIAAMLFAFGAASAVGNAVGGYAVDHWGVGRTTLTGIVGMALGLVALSLPAGTSPSTAAIVVCLVGVSIGLFVPAWQHHLMVIATDAADLALALNLSALNAGIALGAALGGVAVDRGALQQLGLIGGAVAVTALIPALSGLRPGEGGRASSPAMPPGSTGA